MMARQFSSRRKRAEEEEKHLASQRGNRCHSARDTSCSVLVVPWETEAAHRLSPGTVAGRAYR
jgi:hypothetical protein